MIYAAFSPDSRLLVTCSEDKTARVWEAGTGKPLTQPLKHLSHVALAEFSPDARRLVTVADDRTARVWDARTGIPLTEPLKHDAPITSVQFSPDEQQLLTTSADGTVRVWEVPPSPPPVPAWLPALAEAVAGERISDEKGVESVPLSKLFKLKQQLLSDSGQGFYLLWAHWFFADRESRTASPFRAATVPEYVQQRIKGDSTEGLVEALWLSPTNGLVWAGLARKLRDSGFSTNSLLHADAEWLFWAELARKLGNFSNSLLLADAEWFSHRAVELSPDDPHVWLGCADVLHSLAGMAGAFDSADLPGLDPDRAPHLEDACQLYSKVIDLAAADAHAKELLPQALLGRSAVLKMLGRTAEAQADLLRARNLLSGSPQLSPNPVDLSRYYNAGLDEPLHIRANPGNNLSGLPRGLQTLADVQFDVRGLIQLSSSRLQRLDRDADYPEQVNGIEVARRCRRLHFLHASDMAVADGTQIGSYIVHYADGQQYEIPIVYGKDVRDWWVVSNEARAPEQLQIAWTGTNAATPHVRLFKTTWANPVPDLEVTTIDYVSKMTPAAPFLVALTVE